MSWTNRSRGVPSTPVTTTGFGGDVGDVALLEEDHSPRVGEDGRDIRRQEVLALAEADDERHVQPRSDQPLGLARVHHRDRVGAMCLAQRGAYGVGDVAVVRLLDQMRERLGVGFRAELVAAITQGRRAAP